MKKEYFKKSIISLCLVGTLIAVNSFNVFAGTEREFWDMTIRSYGN